MVTVENRLERRGVDVAFLQTNFASIKTGLKAGERVVISDLIPAVEGMLLDPVMDDAAARALIDEAEGRGSVR